MTRGMQKIQAQAKNAVRAHPRRRPSSRRAALIRRTPHAGLRRAHARVPLPPDRRIAPASQAKQAKAGKSTSQLGAAQAAAMRYQCPVCLVRAARALAVRRAYGPSPRARAPGARDRRRASGARAARARPVAAAVDIRGRGEGALRHQAPKGPALRPDHVEAGLEDLTAD